MKKCPYCAEEIQDTAVKCRYCGEWLEKKDEPTFDEDVSAGQISTSPELSSKQSSTFPSAPPEKPKEQTEIFYEVVIGEKNCAYYLAKFKDFDKQTTETKTSWNWSAFFFGGTWALYRKMYVWFFVFLGIMVISGFIEKEGSTIISITVLLAPWIAFTIFANSLYHKHVKGKITDAQSSTTDKSQVVAFLRRKGGVHIWVIWICCLLPIAGILAAIVIPQFAANKSYQEIPKVEAPAAPAAPGEWIDVSCTLNKKFKNPKNMKYACDRYNFIGWEDGTVTDMRTGLMWAAKDNGSDIQWQDAKSYCDNYRGGGYTDWRMPTANELARLYDKNSSYKIKSEITPRESVIVDVHLTKLIELSCNSTWDSEPRVSGDTHYSFSFCIGEKSRGHRLFGCQTALPVRSAK